MSNSRHLALGEATGSSQTYNGRHREFRFGKSEPEGIGLYPLGDRDRDRLIGEDLVETRDCNPNAVRPLK